MAVPKIEMGRYPEKPILAGALAAMCKSAMFAKCPEYVLEEGMSEIDVRINVEPQRLNTRFQVWLEMRQGDPVLATYEFTVSHKKVSDGDFIEDEMRKAILDMYTQMGVGVPA